MSDCLNQIRQVPLIRVFFSSTFSDLKAERDALQARVFPQLERLCLTDGFQFQAIDLRWGVPQEAGLHHRTMRICIEELNRAQQVSPEPNFLILLGDRYGWRPLPEEITVEDYEQLSVAAHQIEPVHSLEPVDALRRWYWLDANSITPCYILQPRRKQINSDPSVQDFTDPNVWNKVEETLWVIINEAFPPEGLINRFENWNSTDQGLPDIVRFQTSATEQEIWHGALNVKDACNHVLAFIREIDKKPEGDDLLAARDFFDYDHATKSIDLIKKSAQAKLIQAIEERLKVNAVRLKTRATLHYHTDESGERAASLTPDHLDELCVEVADRLKQIVVNQIREFQQLRDGRRRTDAQAKDRELEIENDSHRLLAKEFGSDQTFVGRESQLSQIENYLLNRDVFAGNRNDLLLVTGVSGTGKSALLARAYLNALTNSGTHQSNSFEPVIRFIGARPRSSNVRSLLSGLCQELRRLHPLAAPLPTDIHPLQAEFRTQLLENIGEAVTLFLDAVDQLEESDVGLSLDWLPTGSLPRHVKIIVSGLLDRTENNPASVALHAIKNHIHASNHIDLGELTSKDAEKLLANWLRASGRSIENITQQQRIRQRIDSDSECRLPLFIKLLSEEVRRWHWYREAEGQFEEALAVTIYPLREPDQVQKPVSTSQPVDSLRHEHIDAMLGQLFERLVLNHGEVLVERVAGYIAASRQGLSETEILEVLFADNEFKEEIERASEANKHMLPQTPPRIPTAIWARLRSDLASFLAGRASPGAEVLTFYHRIIGDWVRKRYVKPGKWDPHKRLSAYFGKSSEPTRHALFELPFQLYHASLQEQLDCKFNDLAYLDARCSFGDVRPVIDDIERYATPEAAPTDQWKKFLVLHIDRLTEFPTTLFSLVHHEGFPSAKKQATQLGEKGWAKPWIRLDPVHFDESESVPVDGDGNERVCAIVQTKHRYGFATAGCIAAKKQVAFLLSNSSLRLFDLLRAEIRPMRLSSNPRPVVALATTPTADRLALCYEDGQVEIHAIEVTTSHECVSTRHLNLNIPCRVPTTELPTFQLIDRELAYQTADGSVIRTNVDDQGGAVQEIAAPIDDAQQAELSALVRFSDGYFLAFRAGWDTLLMMANFDNGDRFTIAGPFADVIGAAAWGDAHVAVALNDKTLKLVSVALGHVECEKDFRLSEAPLTMSSLGEELVWFDRGGNLWTWQFQSESPRLAEGDVNTIRTFELTHLNAAELGFLSSEFGGRLSFRRGQSKLDRSLRTVDAIYTSDEGRFVVSVHRGRDLLEIRENGKVSATINIDAPAPSRFCYARDGYAVILVAEQSGHAWRVAPEKGIVSKWNLKLNETVSATGRAAGGFWISDRNGKIYYLAVDGNCKLVADVDLEHVGQSQLYSNSSTLIWRGSCICEQFQGATIALVAFRQEEDGNLTETARTFCDPAEGLLTAFSLSLHRDSVVAFVQSSRQISQGIKHGSVESFFNGSAPLVQVTGAASELVSVTFIGKQDEVIAISKHGQLFKFDQTSPDDSGHVQPCCMLAISQRVVQINNCHGDVLVTQSPIVVALADSTVQSLHFLNCQRVSHDEH